MPPTIGFPPDLSNVCVLNTELKKREIVATVESTRHYTICFQLRQKTFEFHSYSMNEITLRKSHRDYVVIVTLRRDDDDVTLLSVTPERKKETVKARTERKLLNALRKAIERINIQDICGCFTHCSCTFSLD